MLDLHRLVKNLSIDKMNDYGGTKHTGVPVKTLKKLLKKAGLKVSGKKATLTRRAKKARLLGGGPGGIGSIKGLPTAVLTPEQQKAKDENDKYLASQAQDKGINAAQKQAIKDETESRVTTTYEKPSLGKFGRSVFEAFRGGKKKRSRRS
jgi:hypothetical protein